MSGSASTSRRSSAAVASAAVACPTSTSNPRPGHQPEVVGRAELVWVVAEQPQRSLRPHPPRRRRPASGDVDHTVNSSRSDQRSASPRPVDPAQSTPRTAGSAAYSSASRRATSRRAATDPLGRPAPHRGSPDATGQRPATRRTYGGGVTAGPAASPGTRSASASAARAAAFARRRRISRGVTRPRQHADGERHQQHDPHRRGDRGHP